MLRYEKSIANRFSQDRLVLIVFYVTIAIICHEPPTVLTAATARLQSCTSNTNNDLPENNEPLLLQKTKDTIALLVPRINSAEGVIELAKDEELILACPGEGNQLVGSGKNAVATLCVRDSELNVYRSPVSSDTQCEKPIQPVVKPIAKVCVRDGSQYEIGFEAEGWHPLITACYSLVTCFTYYTVHTIYGEALRGADDNKPDRSIFAVGERTELFDPSDYYEKDYQEKYFQSLFGNKSSQYYNSNMFLLRGHLVPDGDFVFSSWQFATYFYINAAPRWQSVNDGNWLRVEDMIRQMAQRAKRNITVYTGTYGVLKLDDDQGRYHSLYLTKSKLPVPEFFWKAVHDPPTDRGIVFVTSNNPHLKSEKDVRSLCPDISCSKYKWKNLNLNDTKKGVTYCCEVDNFRKSVPYLPEFRVIDILTDSD